MTQLYKFKKIATSKLINRIRREFSLPVFNFGLWEEPGSGGPNWSIPEYQFNQADFVGLKTHY